MCIRDRIVPLLFFKTKEPPRLGNFAFLSVKLKDVLEGNKPERLSVRFFLSSNVHLFKFTVFVLLFLIITFSFPVSLRGGFTNACMISTCGLRVVVVVGVVVVVPVDGGGGGVGVGVGTGSGGLVGFNFS